MTAEQHTVTLLSLPTELLHRICDFLDTETIVYGLRPLCVSLFAVTQTYNRYKVRLDSPRQMNICRSIPPEHIVLLDFGSGNNVSHWMERLTRLRSLTIHGIHTSGWKHFLQHVATNCRLRTFSISSHAFQDVDDLMQLVSPILVQATLVELSLNFDLSNGEEFLWPRECAITNLSIGTCTFQQWRSILQHSSHLHSLTMTNCVMIEFDDTASLKPYHQLTSVTLNDLQMTMDKLEHVLSLLPSLTHLDLTSSGKPFEFVQRLSRWETFLRLKLPRLSRLECCIFCYCCDWDKFHAMITAFRTPFWLEEKRWFVTCQFRDDWTSSFTAFTSPNAPIPQPLEEHHFDRIICSNPVTID